MGFEYSEDLTDLKRALKEKRARPVSMIYAHAAAVKNTSFAAGKR